MAQLLASSVAMCLLLFSVSASCSDVLAVGPVRVGMKDEEVVRSLGRPAATEVRSGFIRKTYYYNGLVVSFDEDMKVAGIRSSHSSYCLDGWLCPGCGFREVGERLKTANATISANKITIYGDGCWVVATGTSGSVKEIDLKCQP
ncbi:hypothetical protein [Montanilutibacter psychrotolerans]|uniref:hypothetical protein n=1 Tax=Montanilutibacter psychrotolerans TaxID=1327343 RepID=UPI0011CE1E73|nr:hypothetical protein [Lysobacter psychrotolerans]